MNKPLLSVIVPSFNEEENVEPFYFALRETLKDTHYRWEVIYIDDGSSNITRCRCSSVYLLGIHKYIMCRLHGILARKLLSSQGSSMPKETASLSLTLICNTRSI